jgi:hypothetical protein
LSSASVGSSDLAFSMLLVVGSVSLVAFLNIELRITV